MMRIFETLRGLGYEGSYDAVRRYARSWRREHAAVTAQAYVPLTFDPGEAYQFDWSHDVVLINGTTVTVKVAHNRQSLCSVAAGFPAYGRGLIIRLTARRFRCAVPYCDRKTFVEQFAPGVIRARARRTSRLDRLVHCIGVVLGWSPRGTHDRASGDAGQR